MDYSPERTEDSDVASLLARQNEIDRALLRMQKECGIAFYRPHFYQHKFHTSSAKRRGLFAGNRFGKSAANGAETVSWMLGERPFYKTSFDILAIELVLGTRKVVLSQRFDGSPTHPFVRQGIPPWPTKQLIITTNWDKVHEIWTAQDADRPGKFWQYVPKGFVKKTVRNHEGVIDEIYGTNGALVKFQSVDAFKRNPQIAESSDWDRVSLDEPAPEDMWKGAARGLVDRNGQGDFTLTSMQEMWIYDYFNSEEAKDKAGRESWRATMRDNPHLTDIAIEKYAEDLTDDERQCRIEGLPLELSGLVYKEFRRDTHVLKELPARVVIPQTKENPEQVYEWRDFHLPPKDHLLYVRVDPHPQTPHAVSFFALGPSGVPVQCHEIWLATDADSIARETRDYIRSTGLYLAGLKMDPAAWVPDSVTRVASIAQTFAKYDLFASRASKDMTNGILKTRTALKNRKILFSPNCKRTLWEISRYHYDKENKPVDRDDHFMENLRRLCIDLPLPFFDPDRSQGQPIPEDTFDHAATATSLANDF